MKKTVVTFLATILITSTALASAELVKERAKQQRDLNNQQQGVAPAPGYVAPRPAPSVPGAPSPSQGVSAAQQSLIDRFQADCNMLKLGTEATADQKQRLQQDLTLLAKGSYKPSTASFSKLAGHLATALAEKQLPPNDLSKLSKNINIIVNSGMLTTTQSQTFTIEAQAILKRAGVSAPTIQLIGSDLTGMVNEIQKSKPKLYQ